MTDEELGPWIEQLREAVIYFPQTGRMIWCSKPDTTQENRRWNTRYAGTPAFDSWTGRGYLSGRFNGRMVFAHRAVWLLETGRFPRGIDHINGCKFDNRFCNLREADQYVNNKNAARRKDNTSGTAGVVRSGSKWAARIDVGGQRKHLGTFNSKHLAVEARRREQSKNGFTERHGQ